MKWLWIMRIYTEDRNKLKLSTWGLFSDGSSFSPKQHIHTLCNGTYILSSNHKRVWLASCPLGSRPARRASPQELRTSSLGGWRTVLCPWCSRHGLLERPNHRVCRAFLRILSPPGREPENFGTAENFPVWRRRGSLCQLVDWFFLIIIILMVSFVIVR